MAKYPVRWLVGGLGPGCAAAAVKRPGPGHILAINKASFEELKNSWNFD